MARGADGEFHRFLGEAATEVAALREEVSNSL